MKPRAPVVFAAVFGAGLATGLLRVWDPFGVAAVAITLSLAVRRPAVTLLAAALVLGRIAGDVAWLRERDLCSARLPAHDLALRVHLDEPAGPDGGDIGVTPLGAGCAGPVRARWPRRSALDAGMDVRVQGRWVPRAGTGGRPRGMLIVRTVGAAAGEPGLGERLRSMLARESRTLYGGRAPIVDALVLNSRAGMDRELQDRFAQSGLVHLLSISGFHVGLVAAWVVLFARLAGARRDRSLVIGAAVGALYVAFLGWPAPATRAAALTVALARCRFRQRNVQADPLLATTCLVVMLVDPWAVLDLGAWLSAMALWGATTFSRWTDRALGENFWWRTLGSSLGATLATAPITAAALGTVALVGVALNFAAIPVAALAVPGVIASLLLYPVSRWLAEALAAGAGASLRLLEVIADAGSRVPYGHTITEGGIGPALPWAGALLLALWGLGGDNPLREVMRRWGWAATAVLWAVLLRSVRPASAGESSGDGSPALALHFLDVGQGDAAVIRTPGGHWVLIDAGPRDERRDAGRAVVAPFLQRRGARGIAVAVLSHAHLDHLGGLAAVLDRVPADAVLEPGELSVDPLYTGLLDRLRSQSIRWRAGRPGDRFQLDGVRFSVVHPSPGWSGWGEDLNEDSLVLLVEYRDFQAMFAGDAGFPAESAMAPRLRAVDLLKVGHHGSRGSTSERWLRALEPKAAIISVGRNNRYGHPTAEALARLTRAGIRIWRTDRDGTVTVTTDGTRMTVLARDRRAVFDVH